MAVRAQRNTGLIVTLVIFVAAFLISMILAIMFWTKIEQGEAAVATARADLARLGSTADATRYEGGVKATQSPNVVAYLESELRTVKRLATGAEETETSRIRADLAALGVQEGVSALDAARQFKTDAENAQKEVAQLGDQIKAVQDQIAELEKVRDRIDASAKAQQEALAADIAKLQEGVAALDEGQKKELEGLKGAIAKAEADERAKREELELQLRTSGEDLKRLQAQVKVAEAAFNRARPKVPNPSVNVDGQIIRIPAGQNVVYIDLGRKDHLVLGMSFEVFDKARGVDVSEDGRMRGKATIEVISIGDNSAIARVVRSSLGQPAQPGDVIANVVYDKERSYKFYVFGNFNLDGLGGASLTDREMVINLIEQWGGTVVKPEERERALTALGGTAAKENLLPYDTDFLLIGEEPKVDSTGDQADPAVLRRRQQALAQLENFKRLKEEANALGIPILNQNRFLALIGYYQR